MEDFEDRAADRLFARHTLHPRLALAIPCLDPVLPIDHVKAERERVDDFLGEDPLAVDLRGARLDLDLELAVLLRVRELGREEIRDGGHEQPFFVAEVTADTDREGAGLSWPGRDARDEERVRLAVGVREASPDLGRGDLGIARSTSARASSSGARSSTPPPEDRAELLDPSRDTLTERLARCEFRDDRGERGKTALGRRRPRTCRG
jgi:hypothetical protein